MDVLLVGDVHLSDRSPSSRRDSYTDEILAKLSWCVEYANDLGLPIVQAGDLLHIKTPWRTSYGLIQRTHDVLKHVDHGVWIVPGNHDLSNDRLESLDSQPLGALCRMGNVHLLMGRVPELPGIIGIPYLREFDGGDWKAALNPWLEQITDSELLVTHAPIFPPSEAPGVFASLDAAELAPLLRSRGIRSVYYGHIHNSHDSYEVGGVWFCNQGALSRGSLHEETVTRRPAVTIYRAPSSASSLTSA